VRWCVAVAEDDDSRLALVIAGTRRGGIATRRAAERILALSRQARALRREIASDESGATMLDRVAALLGGLSAIGAGLLAPVAPAAALALTVAASAFTVSLVARWMLGYRLRRGIGRSLNYLEEELDRLVDEYLLAEQAESDRRDSGSGESD
jgi:hypothetical protein